jgi:hypothetical protein
MKTANVWSLVMLLKHINSAKQMCQLQIDVGHRDKVVSEEDNALWIRGVVLQAMISAKELNFQSTHDRVWDGGGPFWMAMKVGQTYQKALGELQLDRSKYAMVDGFDDWGQVGKYFPSTISDIKEGLRSYAFERNTATIFHMMRIAEYGMRALARNVRIKLPKKQKLEWSEWGQIIGAMDKEIERRAQSKRRGPAKDAMLEFYRGGLGQINGFKDEFRNQIMHSRRSVYTASEALSVIVHMRDS